MRPGQLVIRIIDSIREAWTWIYCGIVLEVAAWFDARVLLDGARAVVVVAAGVFICELDVELDGEDDIFTVPSGDRDGRGAVALVEVRPVPGLVIDGLFICPALSGVRHIIDEIAVAGVSLGSDRG